MEFIKIHNFCSVKDIVQRIVFKSPIERNYLQITHRTKKLYQVFKGK